MDVCVVAPVVTERSENGKISITEVIRCESWL